MKNKVRHNIFEGADGLHYTEDTLSHGEQMEMIGAFMTGDKATFEDVALEHGLTNMDQLFPDPVNYGGKQNIDDKDEWSNIVINGVTHAPKEKIKTEYFDLTGEEARARGYIKGNEKVEEQIAIFKRSSEATFVYKLQSLDKDDEIEMDFDLLGYYRNEMRVKLRREDALAILLGDGRPALVGDNPNPDKIDETKIRPILTDNEFFTRHINVTGVTTASTKAQIASAFIDEVTLAMGEFEGTAGPKMFVDNALIQQAMLLKNTIGERIYKTKQELCDAMGISDLVDTEPLKNGKRTLNGDVVAAVIVNPKDYVVGTNPKGQVKFYDDFVLRRNRTDLLIENRFSGMLTKYHSAIVITIKLGNNDVLPFVKAVIPAGTETRYGKTVATLQTGVRATGKGIVGTLNYVTGYTGYDATNPDGYFLAFDVELPTGFTSATVETVGSGRPASSFTSEDKTCVTKISDPKKEFIRLTCTAGGKTVVEDYNLMGLILKART